MKKYSHVLGGPTLQPILDAMQDSAAIVSLDGTIIAVNQTWRKFCRENSGDLSNFNVGDNYMSVCQASARDGIEVAGRVESGIFEVLKMGSEFHAEYACHSDTTKRWFAMFASPFIVDDERYALICHRNITTLVRSRVETADATQNAQDLAAVVATMSDAVIAFDLEGRITSWNFAATELYGYERSEMVGQSMELIYPPNWPMSIGDYITEIVASELRHFDAIRRTKTGKLREVSISAAPIRSGDGKIIGISNVHRDVTKERQSEQRTRSILNNLFAFVGVLDLNGTLLDANRAPLDAAGLEATDVIGKKFWDCYWWSYASSVQESLKAACDRARAGGLVRYDVEVRVVGGELIWIDFQIAPLRNADGDIVNLIPSGIDISERKAMEVALKTSHDTFQNMVARSPFGIYTVDADFLIAHVSDGAKSVFNNVRPLIGRDLSDALRIIWPESFAKKAIDLFKHTLATGEPYRAPAEVERRHDKDEVESYDWMIERMQLPDGRLGVVCNFYDLSERRKYEQHINLLMREVNHRSKNLLTIVMSMARQTARISSSADFISSFSERLLGLSASQDLIVRRDWKGVGVRDLVLSQLDHLSDEIKDQRVRLEGPDVVISPSAAEGIGMALHELATNALKYGSLSGNAGLVLVEWYVNEEDRTFHMQWLEHDGPPVSPPSRSGFGRIVIQQMAADSVGGEVVLDYPKSGALWRLTAPLDEIKSTRRQ